MAARGHNSSSALTLDPLNASVLAARETIRRDANQQRGTLRSGCAELDGYVLLGGLERGSVVGISSEVEEFSVKLAIQVLAKGLCDGAISKALVITPRPRLELLRALRDGLITANSGDSADRDVRRLLDKVMLSCVFDVDGLWEVLADLDRNAAPNIGTGASGRTKSQSTPVPASIPDVPGVPEASLEIKDSEDEDSDEELSPPPAASPPKSNLKATPAATEAPAAQEAPDIIIVTHISSLLTSLFTHRSPSAAHSTLQLLSSHIRHLSRTLSSSPLVLLLNGTTTSTSGPANSNNPNTSNAPGGGGGSGGSNRSSKPLDPTLRSIFNPPPLAGSYPSAAGNAWTRRNKPTFGLVFAQMLDMHMLCTRVPRSSRDADEVFGLPQQEQGQQKQQKDDTKARYVTVVEVLLDEMGVWEEGRKRGPRRSREQRWAAVDSKDGKIVDAFAMKERVYGELRLAAGFGGPRV